MLQSDLLYITGIELVESKSIPKSVQGASSAASRLGPIWMTLFALAQVSAHTMKRPSGFGSIIACTVLAFSSMTIGRVSFAQSERVPQPSAPRTLDLGPAASATIAVDGVLDEPAWQSAAVIDELTQREPEPGTRPTERTEVRLLYDESSLYIGVICFDSDMDAVIGTQMARDARLDDDDRIEIVLDTFQDRRNAVYFATNPAGALATSEFLGKDRNFVVDIFGLLPARARFRAAAERAHALGQRRLRASAEGFPGHQADVSRVSLHGNDEARF